MMKCERPFASPSLHWFSFATGLNSGGVTVKVKLNHSYFTLETEKIKINTNNNLNIFHRAYGQYLYRYSMRNPAKGDIIMKK